MRDPASLEKPRRELTNAAVSSPPGHTRLGKGLGLACQPFRSPSLVPPVLPALTVLAAVPSPLHLSVLEVVPPQGSDLVLASHVPDGETDVLVLYRFHVEACRRLDQTRKEKSSERKKLRATPGLLAGTLQQGAGNRTGSPGQSAGGAGRGEETP